MAQRTIAPFFSAPKPSVRPVSTDDRPTGGDVEVIALKDTTNRISVQNADDSFTTNINDTGGSSGGGGGTATKKRPAVPLAQTARASASKRPTLARPFIKGADVVPVDKAEYNDEAVEFCHVQDRGDYLLSSEAWACNDLTKPVASWWTPPADPNKFHASSYPALAFGGRFKVIDGSRGLVVCAQGGVLRCHRVPDIGDAPLATLCMTHSADANACGCLKHEHWMSLEPNAVQSMASYGGDDVYGDDATGATTTRGGGGGGGGGDAPNLMVTTRGGELKLISVKEGKKKKKEEEEEKEEEETRGGDGSRGGAVTMTLVASVLLTEGPFKYAFPAGEYDRRLGACVMWRDPADATIKKEKENENNNDDDDDNDDKEEGRRGDHRSWAPVTAAVVSSVNGQLCFIKISPGASPSTAAAELRRTVTPHLPGVGVMKRYGSKTWDARLWKSGPGGAAVVTVGSDGNVVVTHFNGGTEHDNAWQCVTRKGSAAHMLDVCDATGTAVTASNDEEDVHVWDLAGEKRLRKVKMGSAGKSMKRQFTLMKVAVGGVGGRLVAASNSNRTESAVLQLVRGR